MILSRKPYVADESDALMNMLQVLGTMQNNSFENFNKPLTFFVWRSQKGPLSLRQEMRISLIYNNLTIIYLVLL